MQEFIKSPVRTLSLGQRMRADIAASMLHSPKVLFLDEPTIGLDVVVKDNIRKAIAKINKQDKTTIILTTHDLNDIETLCERIVMIDKGKMVYDGSLMKMKNTYGKIREVDVSLFDENSADKIKLSEAFGLTCEDYDIEKKGTGLVLKFDSSKVNMTDMLNYILKTVGVRDIAVKEADIEEIIRMIYRSEVKLSE